LGACGPQELRIETSEEAEEDASLARTVAQFNDFMLQYSGEKYQSQDLPRLHDEEVDLDGDEVRARVSSGFGSLGVAVDAVVSRCRRWSVACRPIGPEHLLIGL
jgi:hypothetical protein